MRVVAYNFIIGEAGRGLPDEFKARHLGVLWLKIQGLRNAAVHEYFCLDAALLWRTMQDEPPPLEASLRGMFEES